MTRRLILTILLALLLAAPASAQIQCYGKGCDYWNWSSLGATLTSGQLMLPEGTAAKPALSWTNAPTMGFYNSASNIYWSSAGIARGVLSGGTLQLLQDSGYFAIGSSADARIYRDAANTLALRNGTNAQTFNIYNTYTDASNYERGGLKWSGNSLYLFTEAAGSGANRAIYLDAAANAIYADALYPIATDARTLGIASAQWSDLHLSRSTQGSKTKALTEGAETAVTQIAVPQTAGSNFADANIEWGVYATDGTDSQRLRGTTLLAAVNKAGTESCSVEAGETPASALSAGTLTCTATCITGLTDVVQFALNCTSSLTQTTLSAQAFVQMLQPNTLTPQP